MDGDEDLLRSEDGRDDAKGGGLRERIAHFTWANFTCTQSTGGIAILLSLTPHQFYGLQTAGVVIFIFNLVLFMLFCTMMIVRFVLHPYMVKRSFTNPPELFFFGSFWLSMATVIICIQQFGVPNAGDWIVTTIRVLFWIYAAVTLVYTTVIWVVVAARSPIDPLHISPAIFLMIFNTMLSGTIAGSIAQSQPPAQRLPIIVAGIAYQGLGWIMCTILLPWFIGNFLSNGLGTPDQRPGLFMPVGSSGYTVVSLIGCARSLPRGYGFFARFPGAVDVLQVVATWVSIFLWLFAFWLFAIALVANLPVMLPDRQMRPRMGFTLSWWGLVFPNVGLTIATTMIGEELQSDAVQWVATVMTILLFVVWLMDLGLHVKALVTGQIMWPGKDEDVLKSS
ncbi:voltage-dependent anion channel [Jackrogersella minutella]|nr:voltage-dependent anion channel [Jackrogersella minutella]